MAPLVRPSWSPQGHTPELRQRTRAHKSVSVIACLCVSPGRDAVHMYFRLHAGANINAPRVLEFLRVLRRRLEGSVVLVWDRLQAHRARVVQHYVANNKSLHTYHLPPYAPELNPVENVWSYLKMNPMSNLAITDLGELADVSRRHSKALQRRQHLLRAFIAHTPLPLGLK